MDNEPKKIINAEPAAYPATSTPEIENRDILVQLLGSKYIRGDIRIMDKYPNSDGILEIIDDRGIHVGYIDVQLKTLAERDYNSPKYQCDIKFLAYCDLAILPVLLIAVNRKDRKAYWKLIDRTSLTELTEKIKGESVSVTLPKENCIDGSTDKHFVEWTTIIRDIRMRNWNSEQLAQQKKTLEAALKYISEKTENPVDLPLPALRELHGFLDQYNYILDIEFPSVKNILYPEYWKIGLGIIEYNFMGYHFILYPVEYKKNQTLIKNIQVTSETDFSRDMFEGSVLMVMMGKSVDKIREYPKQFAYDLLDDKILKAVEQNNLPIPDEFLANEYLVNFIDKNWVYLGFEKDANEYSLKDLKYRLQKILPMVSAFDKTYADWVTESNDSVESYQSYRPGGMHPKKMEEAQKKIDEGVEPKVKVTITSSEFNIDLIYYYIDFLEEVEILFAVRQYQTNQRDLKMYGVDLWKTWNVDVLWNNFQLVIENFPRCYELYVDTHFPRLKQVLQITEADYISLGYLLESDEGKRGKPSVELYTLRPFRIEEPSIYFFDNTNNQIDRKKYWIDRDFECKIDGKEYRHTGMKGIGLDFLFEISPMYAYIKKEITHRLKEYFKGNTKM